MTHMILCWDDEYRRGLQLVKSSLHHVLHYQDGNSKLLIQISIDREAGEIMRLVASVCLCVCVFVCLSKLSCLNHLTYGWPFIMVAVLTGCAIAVDHAFNTRLTSYYNLRNFCLFVCSLSPQPFMHQQIPIHALNHPDPVLSREKDPMFCIYQNTCIENHLLYSKNTSAVDLHRDMQPLAMVQCNCLALSCKAHCGW